MDLDQTYIVCATMRSGSSLLCNLLEKTRLAGSPKEFLRGYIRDGEAITDNEYIQFISREMSTRSTNKLSGVKMMWWNFDEVLKRLRSSSLHDVEGISDLELIERVFPNVKFVFITRQNKVSQAVSLCLAAKTKVWKQDKTTKKRINFLPRVSNFSIYQNIQNIEKQELLWKRFFADNSISAHTVTYESLAQDYKESVFKTLEFLGVSKSEIQDVPQPDLSKQANLYNEIIALKFNLYVLIIKALPQPVVSRLQAIKSNVKRSFFKLAARSLNLQ